MSLDQIRTSVGLSLPCLDGSEDELDLRNFGAILLVSCYELGHQPLGVALPLAFLEKAGFQPDVTDLSLTCIDEEKVKRAELVAISVPMHTALRIGVDAARQILRINVQCRVVFFGLYASMNQALLFDEGAAFVIGGEYELPLQNLMVALDSQSSLDIAGLSRPDHPTGPYLEHLPFIAPVRDRLPELSAYAHLVEKGVKKTVAGVESSRGCRHLCRHCPIPPVYGGRFFLVPADIVFEDICRVVEAGAEHITFTDPDFLNGAKHGLRLCRRLHEAFPNVSFDFTAKVSHLIQYRGHLPEFRELGCIFIICAFESFDDVILSQLQKGHSAAESIAVFHETRALGLPLRPTFMPFTPWANLLGLQHFFDVIEKEGMIDYIDPVQYSIRLLIPPGSLILDDEHTRQQLGELNSLRASYDWSNSDARLDVLQRQFAEEVEKRSEMDCDAADTYFQLREYLNAMIENRSPQVILPVQGAEREHPPRMSEPWFCCAEPTIRQLDSSSLLN